MLGSSDHCTEADAQVEVCASSGLPVLSVLRTRALHQKLSPVHDARRRTNTIPRDEALLWGILMFTVQAKMVVLPELL